MEDGVKGFIYVIIVYKYLLINVNILKFLFATWRFILYNHIKKSKVENAIKESDFLIFYFFWIEYMYDIFI